MKKTLAVVLISALALTVGFGCSRSSDAPAGAQVPAQSNAPAGAQASAPSGGAASNFNSNREITVVSRESGSGTRGAFIELTGVEVRVDGNTTDMTSPEAVIGNGTNAIMTNVAGDTYAIGYISTGSVNSTIKTVNIDGVEPTAANILAGSYKIARPFIVVTMDNLNAASQDFLNFIMSKEGQEIVADRYIPVDTSAPAFQSSGAAGVVVTGGSTSVSPVMERLAEGYRAINPGVTIEIHSTGSGAGITGAIDGVVDIGMSSRDIRDSEMEQLNQQLTIAMDGIAIIVNNDNPLTNLSMDEVREIFTGERSRWSDVG